MVRQLVVAEEALEDERREADARGEREAARRTRYSGATIARRKIASRIRFTRNAAIPIRTRSCLIVSTVSSASGVSPAKRTWTSSSPASASRAGSARAGASTTSIARARPAGRRRGRAGSAPRPPVPRTRARAPRAAGVRRADRRRDARLVVERALQSHEPRQVESPVDALEQENGRREDSRREPCATPRTRAGARSRPGSPWICVRPRFVSRKPAPGDREPASATTAITNATGRVVVNRASRLGPLAWRPARARLDGQKSRGPRIAIIAGTSVTATKSADQHRERHPGPERAEEPELSRDQRGRPAGHDQPAVITIGRYSAVAVSAAARAGSPASQTLAHPVQEEDRVVGDDPEQEHDQHGLGVARDRHVEPRPSRRPSAARRRTRSLPPTASRAARPASGSARRGSSAIARSVASVTHGSPCRSAATPRCAPAPRP